MFKDEQTDEKAEELSRKRTMLAAFLKLIIFNVFDMGLAAPVLSFLNKVSHYIISSQEI